MALKRFSITILQLQTIVFGNVSGIILYIISFTKQHLPCGIAVPLRQQIKDNSLSSLAAAWSKAGGLGHRCGSETVYTRAPAVEAALRLVRYQNYPGTQPANICCPCAACSSDRKLCKAQSPKKQSPLGKEDGSQGIDSKINLPLSHAASSPLS